MTYTFAHVKGHQDKHIKYEEPTFQAKMNYHCDYLARAKAQSLVCPTRRTVQTRPPATKVMLRSPEGFLTERLCNYLYKKEYRKETKGRLRIEEEVMQEIDWEAPQG